MNQPMSLARRIAVLAFGCALVAGITARAQSDSVAPPPASPPAPVAPAPTDLKNYTYEQRSDFIIAVRTAAAKIDALIVPLTKREKGGIAGGANAIALEKLQSSRTELGHQLGKLEDITPENWNSLRDATVDALIQTQDAYVQAAKE